MTGILFNDIIFGPIKSRRLGNSLGINLLPKDIKLCTFDCIYCECGWGKTDKILYQKLHSAQTMIPIISQYIQNLHNDGVPIDSITYSGNGEPTIHPEFAKINDAIIELRNKYYPEAVISCLSNSTQLHRQDVLDALCKIDNPLMKLDSGIQETMLLMNKPFVDINVETICEQLCQFKGNLTVQTMFLRGELEDGTFIDNTTEKEVEAWLKCVQKINPHTVMIYPIDRETPARKLEKIDRQTLEKIAQKVNDLGIKAFVY